MAIKYFLLAVVAVLAVQSEAKVVSSELLKAQERIDLACIGDVIAESKDFKDKVLGELRECGLSWDHVLVVEAFERIKTEGKENIDRVLALIGDALACNDVGCLWGVAEKMIEEVKVGGQLVRSIVYDIFEKNMEEHGNLIECTISAHDANTGKFKEIVLHALECIAN